MAAKATGRWSVCAGMGVLLALTVAPGCADEPADSAPLSEGAQGRDEAAHLTEIRYLSYRAGFGFDADSGLTTDSWRQGELRPAAIVLTLGSDDWDFSYRDTSEFCQVLLDISDLAPAAAPVPGQWWSLEAFDLDGAHDCGDFDWKTRFGMDPVAYFGQQLDWTLSIGPTTSVIDELLDGLGDEHSVGGRLDVHFASGASIRSLENAWTTGHPVDPDLHVPEEAQPLPADALNTGALPSGHYTVQITGFTIFN